MTKSFDVFLSHNSKDKPAVRALAEALQDRGLKVWLDEWELVPGRPWQEALEEVIVTTGSSVVLVGKDGLGPWQDKEMRSCLSEFVDRNLPVIPVLLPGAPDKPMLPIFLKGFTWVDLRSGLTEEGLDRLQWGITGKRPIRSNKVSPPPRNEERGVREPVISGWKKAGWGAGVVAIAVLVGLAVLKLPRLSPCVPGKEREVAGITFVRICPGTFTMGSTGNGQDNERPAHLVKLSEFWLGKTEVTNEQYRRFRTDHQGEAELPVTSVRWDEAKAACESFGGRLPTEAEWEYAARAGSQAAWSFGENVELLGEYVWFDDNSGSTEQPVGTKKANAWGLYDMHGNVVEWVADWYGLYSAAAQSDPTGPTAGELRVWRGGAFLSLPEALRSAFRYGHPPASADVTKGFRCAHNPFR